MNRIINYSELKRMLRSKKNELSTRYALFKHHIAVALKKYLNIETELYKRLRERDAMLIQYELDREHDTNFYDQYYG